MGGENMIENLFVIVLSSLSLFCLEKYNLYKMIINSKCEKTKVYLIIYSFPCKQITILWN